MASLRFALIGALLFMSTTALAAPETHVVAPGHTLGKIARRYNVSIEALARANRLSRTDPIKPGQQLVIPDRDDPDGSKTKPPPAERDDADDKAEDKKAEDKKAEDKKIEEESGPQTRAVGRDGMRAIDVPGSGPAYYYEPTGAGRKSLKPVLVYMHGRGGTPMSDCRRWAPVARRLGWLVCPSGPGAQGDGRGWNNNWVTGQRAAVGAVNALRAKYGRRVQLRGNTLIGFSEGAYVAMNVGVREPRTFNRWLILAADNDYWGGSGLDELKRAAGTVRRVYLITGEQDGVIAATDQVKGWLKNAGIDTRVSTPKDMGHEVALERKAAMYRAALVWLEDGGGSRPAREHVASR